MNSSHEFILIRKLVLLVILSAVPLIWSGIHPTNYTAASPAEEIEPTFVPGELIVKFSDSVTKSASDVINRKATFRNATTDRSDSLDRLNQKFGVGRARPVLRTDLDTARLPNTSLAALKRYHQDRTEAIRQEFPSRSLRAAPGSTIPDLSHVYLLELPKEADILASVAEFSADPHVVYAQPNYRYQLLFTPNDPFFSSSGSWGQPYDDLWGLKKIQMEPAWDVTQRDGMVVAVVDTGLDYNHPDIATNVWTNDDEIAGNGLDDDGNGFIDDVRGWDFVAPGIGDNDPMDDNGHGTHISGTIAAVADNGIGIVGVAPEAQIMPIKALNAAGFYTSVDAAAGLHYAADNGADVVNNSWGCEGCFSDPVTEEGVTYAHGFGVVVVFAAGNKNRDVVSNAPQNQPEVLLVSAFDENDEKASFSSFGLMVDVAAPGGSNVRLPGEDCPLRPDLSSNNILSLQSSILAIDPDCIVSPGYLRIQGTSMAAPHVAGLAALILAQHPTLTNEEVRQVIRTSADDVDAPGVDINSGRGRINAAQALATGSVLQVIITSPRSTTLLGPQASFDVIGTATGANFVSYELSVGLGTAPTEWQLIAASSSPVVDNVLGTWGELGQGFVTLRLAAIDTQGITYDTYATVFVDKASPLVTDPGVQSAPAIDGNRVVWQDNRNGNFDIYMFDLTTNTERQITTNTSSQTLPAIHGDRIVWQDNRNGNSDIYLFDLSTNTEQQITTNLSSQTAPAIHEDRIVWEDNRNGNLDIYLYDLSTSIEQQITNDPDSQIRPAISGPGGRYIVWEDFRNVIVNANRDIFLYDVVAGTEQQITSSTLRDAAPDISGNRIVWMADYNADPVEIVFIYHVFVCTYDPATGACPAQQITPDEAEAVGPATTPPFGRGPRISGAKVVWRDARQDFEVFAHNLTDGTEHQITLSPTGGVLDQDQADPDVSDNAVLWIDRRNGNLDIFHVSLNPSAEILTPPDLAEFAQGQAITIEGFAFDLFDGIVNSSLAWTAKTVTSLDQALGTASSSGELLPTFSYPAQFIVEVWVGKTDDCEGLGCFATSSIDSISLSGLEAGREYRTAICPQIGCQLGPTIQLGTGESIVVNTLSASWHLITLTATDSDGNTGKDQIDIRVN